MQVVLDISIYMESIDSTTHLNHKKQISPLTTLFLVQLFYRKWILQARLHLTAKVWLRFATVLQQGDLGTQATLLQYNGEHRHLTSDKRIIIASGKHNLKVNPDWTGKCLFKLSKIKKNSNPWCSTRYWQDLAGLTWNPGKSSAAWATDIWEHFPSLTTAL